MRDDAEVPAGWRRTRFGDVVANVNKSTKDPAADGLDRIVGLDNLDSQSLTLHRWDMLESLPDGTSFTRTFKAGQVLFGKRRAYQRKVAVPDFDGICSGDILVFEPVHPDLLGDFLPYVVQSDGFFDHALGTSAGSLSPRTKWQELAKYEFVLPPVDEQKQIVELLNGADQVCNAYGRVETEAENLWLAIAHNYLNDEAAVPLESIATVELGKKRDPKLLLEGTPTPYLRAANVKFGNFNLDDVREMNFTEQEIEKFSIEPGDVLVTEGCGSIAEVGACATWHSELSGQVCFQMTLLCLRSRDESLAQLLHHWAAFSFRSGAFADVASGTSVYHLSAARVRRMPFPDLPEAVRIQAVAELEAAQQLQHRASAAKQKANILAGSLRDSLLRGRVRV